LLEPAPKPTEAAHAIALQLLERHGVLTREAVMSENVVGGFSSVYGVLKVLEERGQVRRGYFVSGLGAAQFAAPGAVDRLRSVRNVPDANDPRDLPPVVLLAATDPAQPFGSTLPWPATVGRPSRSSGALVACTGGQALVWFDRRSHHLVTFPAAAGDRRWADGLTALAREGRARSVEVRKVNGEPLDPHSAIAEALGVAGFVTAYRGVVYRAPGP
jgi:ATP-dependent Lhr-like helicase